MRKKKKTLKQFVEDVYDSVMNSETPEKQLKNMRRVVREIYDAGHEEGEKRTRKLYDLYNNDF